MTQLAEHSGQFSLDGQRAAETMHKLLDMFANMEKNIAVSYLSGESDARLLCSCVEH